MDIVADSSYVTEGIKFTQKSDKCPSISTLAWRNQIRFVIVSIVCCGNFHVLMYDIEGIANYGYIYIVFAFLSMIFVVWPIMFMEMVIGQKFEANMLNSLGQISSCLWTFGGIGTLIGFANFISTNMQMTGNGSFPFSLT